MDTFDAIMQRGGDAAIRAAGRFFVKDDPVHQTLNAIAQRLTELQIPYCIAGGMALVAHGYDRTTIGVDVIVIDFPLKALSESMPQTQHERARRSGVDASGCRQYTGTILHARG